VGRYMCEERAWLSPNWWITALRPSTQESWRQWTGMLTDRDAVAVPVILPWPSRNIVVPSPWVKFNEAAMEKDYLVLKRAALSRPSGQSNDDDFDVLCNGEVVGRIFKANAAPVGEPAHPIPMMLTFQRWAP